jgi:thioredoxin reductase (NADPH)
MGPELMLGFKEQAVRFGAKMETVKASRVDLSARPFKVWVGDPDSQEPTYLAQSLIVATGAKSLMLGLPNETRLIGHGVSTCATCDGFFFRDQHIAVVGGGDSAIEEATFLTKFASKVTIIHRRDELRASKIMQERAFANEKIEFLWDTEVVEIKGEATLEGLVVRNNKTDEQTDLDVTGLFVAIGHRPNSDLFVDQLQLDDEGYIKTDAPSSRTNIEGVFACGDVQDKVYRQAITSAGSGCTAAIDAERWLEAQEDVAEALVAG